MISSNEYYWNLIEKAWPKIIFAYRSFESKKPILEYRLPERKIYICPGEEYIDSLTPRTREKTREEYRQACLENKMMIFVKDMKKQILKSYIADIDQQT
jgi:hypothetical protein